MSFSLKWFKNYLPLFSQVRFGHRLRGKPPGVAKSLKQRLELLLPTADSVKRNDIGYPFIREPRSSELMQRLEWIKKQKKDANLEKLAKNNKLNIDMNDVEQEWFKTGGPFQIKSICDHYGVFKDLFGEFAYFVPRVYLNIRYKSPVNENEFCPVYYGNRLEPNQTKQAPEINFDPNFSIKNDGKSEEKNLYTLCVTNPDGHLNEDNKEYIHWMISNIPNGNVINGETIVPYLQPLPYKGTGYHRFIFVLYKQVKKLDLAEYKVKESDGMEPRTFSTYDFYKQNQELITPAGISFFQTKYDDSVRDVFHNKLNKKQPIFEYEFPEAYLKYQQLFPKKQPFNLYLDRYADPKDVNKRFLERRLAKTHPFDGPDAPLKFPSAHTLDDKLPSWLKTEVRKERLRRGRINDAE